MTSHLFFPGNPLNVIILLATAFFNEVLVDKATLILDKDKITEGVTFEELIDQSFDFEFVEDFVVRMEGTYQVGDAVAVGL